jgi:hypothetical protein
MATQHINIHPYRRGDLSIDRGTRLTKLTEEIPPGMWRRSSRCEAGACLEVKRVGPGVAMRDAKAAGGPVLVFRRPAWEAFVEGVRAGDFESR